MTLTRREALKLGLIGSGSLLLPWNAKAKPAFAQFSPQIPRFNRSFCPHFELPFCVPKVLEPIRKDSDTDLYEIKVEKVKREIIPGLQTEIWSYNGLLPGPTIRQRGGEEKDGGRLSVVRFINKLGEDRNDKNLWLTTHLHGMASQPYYDGHAEDYIYPGCYKDYEYPNNRAATIWYHDHALDLTAEHVYRGLAGMYIVEDQCELDLALPKGEFDVPLILQDKRFADDGSLVINDNNGRNIYGDVMLVNGVPWPRMEVVTRMYRFRILNASASRNYQLVLSREQDRQTIGDELIVIGTDAGLMSAPVTLKSPTQVLPVAVAERYDVIIDFSKYPLNSKVYLRNVHFSGTIDVDTRSHTLMRFDVVRQEKDPIVLPAELRRVDPITEPVVRTRTFRFERNGGLWKINNKVWDKNRVDANPKLGDVEIWNLVNPGSGWLHPVHIHFVDLQLISRNGRPPRPYERGWKDVFVVGEFETVRVIAKYSRPKEGNKVYPFGKYMMHCHNLVHEDMAMMTLFEIGENGPDPLSVPCQPISEMPPL